MKAWNKGKNKKDYPQLSNSGVKKGNIPWNKGKQGEYKITHEKQFKKGVAPVSHKDGCECFRCTRIPYNKGGVNYKQSLEHIAKRVAKLKGHKSFRLTKFTDNELYMKKLERNKYRLKLRREGHTEEEWENLKIQYQFMCLCCKRIEPAITLTRDHIVPITRGGTDEIGNIQPLCKACNNEKFTKSISYLPSTNNFRKEKGVVN